MATRIEESGSATTRRGQDAGIRVSPDVPVTIATTSVLDVSVLVPAKDEAANLPEFLDQMASAFHGSEVTFEVIVIDDGSVDGSWALLGQLEPQYPFLVRIRHRRCRGISDALRTGYLASRGRVLVFYPADLQYKPEDLPTLVSPILSGWVDMVTGTKRGKYEKAFVSSVYNWLSRRLFSIPVRDLNGVKAYRREVMEVLPIRPDWHRYMIVVAAAEGYSVAEVPIPLYPRHAGVSKFNRSRIIVGMLDMVSVWFELRFRPVRPQAAPALRWPGWRALSGGIPDRHRRARAPVPAAAYRVSAAAQPRRDLRDRGERPGRGWLARRADRRPASRAARGAPTARCRGNRRCRALAPRGQRGAPPPRPRTRVAGRAPAGYRSGRGTAPAPRSAGCRRCCGCDHRDRATRRPEPAAPRAPRR